MNHAPKLPLVYAINLPADFFFYYFFCEGFKIRIHLLHFDQISGNVSSQKCYKTNNATFNLDGTYVPTRIKLHKA